MRGECRLVLVGGRGMRWRSRGVGEEGGEGGGWVGKRGKGRKVLRMLDVGGWVYDGLVLSRLDLLCAGQS